MSISRVLAYKKTIFCIFLLFVGVFFLLFFESKPKRRDENNRGMMVQTVNLVRGSHHPLIPMIASAKPRENTSVTAFVSSKVLKVNFSAGDTVKKGQLLIELDDHIFKNELEKNIAIVKRIEVEKEINKKQCIVLKNLLAHAKKLHGLSQAEYDRNAKLHTKRFVSKADLDIADQKQITAEHTMQEREFSVTNCLLKNDTLAAQLKEAKSRETQSEKNVTETKVFAPYDGVVTQKNVSVGRTVTIGQTLLVMYDPHSVELEALIPESIYQQIANYEKNLVACEHSQKSKQCFILSRIGKNVSALGVGHTGYFKSIENAYIPNGTTLRIYLALPKVSSFLIPASALYESHYIYLINNNRLKRYRVTRLGYAFLKHSKPSIVIAFDSRIAGKKILSSFMPDARTGVYVRYNEPKKHDKK